MKAQDLPFTQLLEGNKQFVVPIFQRTYSWEIEHCQQLWDDIYRVGSSAERDSHFLGSAVYIPSKENNAAISQWLIIDGQQRITTLTLLFLCIKEKLEKENLDEPVSPAFIEESYLKNRHGKGDLQYKILLTKTDKKTIISLIEGKKPCESTSLRVIENYEFFTQKIATADLSVIYAGIKKLMIVDVSLQQGIDNPQMIFESMNSTGKALTQADLIRNYILMGLPHELQTRLYNDYWRPMEVLFGAENYNKEFDVFVRFFLVIRTGNHKVRKDEVYNEFKAYSRNIDVEALLADLKEFSSYYCAIALGNERDTELAYVFHDIRELRVDVCYPFLMSVYEDYVQERISKKEFLEIGTMVESYVFRRAVCDIPTNSMRQTFATLHKYIDHGKYLESIKAAFLTLPSYRRFPNDHEFLRQIKIRNLYKFNRRSYWLRRFENHGKKERVFIQDYTIEHILPQNENLNEQWQKDLGENWKEIQEKYLHTLGNLTLTGYNSEYSDKSFQQKRDMKGGFHESPLRLNQGLGNCEIWNEDAIKARANKLAEHACLIWRTPTLSDEILDFYRDNIKKNGRRKLSYTRNDHHHIQSGISKILFDQLSKEVLALDECVRLEYLKSYIAFKAETNFVDVVAQSKRLKLRLNMNFSDIDDPRERCADWGNGDVEVIIEKPEDIPYVVGLIRQSLEIQLGCDTIE